MTESLLLRRLAAIVVGVNLAACGAMSGMTGSGGGSAPAKVSDGVLVGPNGMTLYTFDKDAPNSGKSVCNGQCATAWPPLMAQGSSTSGSGDWTVVTRDDGSRQWAYKGKPLYYWVKDTKPGDRTGDNVNNAWRIARP